MEMRKNSRVVGQEDGQNSDLIMVIGAGFTSKNRGAAPASNAIGRARA